MTSPNPAWRAGAAIVGAALCTVAPWAQPAAVAPLRTTPTEQVTVKVPFRDWGPTTIAGTTILGGGNRGLYAVDTLSGKVRWSFRPTGTAHGNPFVATAPAVSGDSVIVPFGNTLMAVSLATGKELWRGPATAQGAIVAVDAGIAYVRGADNNFRALDAATGREKWKMSFTRDSCESVPLVREGTVYVSGNILVKPGDANSPASYSRHLFALDASTGRERWRSPPAPLPQRSACLRHPVVTADTYFAVSDEALHAVTLATGRERWAPVETRRMVDGRLRLVEVFALVDAGSTLVGLTMRALMAFDKDYGAMAWMVTGQYT